MRIRQRATMLAVLAGTAMLVTAAPVSAGVEQQLPVFNVVKAGLTSDEAARLGAAFGVDAAFGDGSVRYVSPSFGDVPMKDQHKRGRDESGQDTLASFFDFAAIKAIKPVPDADALDLVRRAFDQAGVVIPGDPKPEISHTAMRFKPIKNKAFRALIDTSVNFRFELAGLPLVGPGADVGVTLDPHGGITDIREAAFTLEPGPLMPLIPTADAKRLCQQRYPRGSTISLSLEYFAPPVSPDVQQILPYYVCDGTAKGGGTLVSALVPAVQSPVTPGATIKARLAGPAGDTVTARVHIKGGTAPYHIQWLTTSPRSSTEASSTRSLSYRLRPSGRLLREGVMAVVTDANGLSATAERDFAIPDRLLPRSTDASRGGVSPSAVGPLDVGAELNVTNWQCVQDSASGFWNQFTSRGYTVAFEWLAPDAWERDFRDTPTRGGDDSTYVDNVDLAWYTGHGSPGSFTFDNNTQTDGDITPSDARWGNRDLEWLQLESCNVLQFTDGSGTPIWSRWSQVFDGLHLLNGFQTTAQCVNVTGGTAGEFSDWLLGKSFGGFHFAPLRVRQAWAMMALSLEPSGKQYVTMGVYGSGGVTNYDDYFWGLGPVGPDIPKSQITGYWWLMGQV